MVRDSAKSKIAWSAWVHSYRKCWHSLATARRLANSSRADVARNRGIGSTRLARQSSLHSTLTGFEKEAIRIFLKSPTVCTKLATAIRYLDTV